MQFTNYILKKMIDYHIIDNDDKEIYIYGLNTGIMIIINLFTFLIFSYLMKELDMAIILLLSFIPLRSLSGGIHCSSKFVCYIVSNTTMLILLGLLECFRKRAWFILILATISGYYVFSKKVANSHNRNLDDYEIIFYSSSKKKIICLLFFIIIMLLLMHKFEYAVTIMCSIILSAVLLILDVKKKI